MAYTWADLKSSISYKLSDSSEERYPSASLLSYANDAIKVFASSHTPKFESEVFTHDGSTKIFTPANTNLINVFEVRESDAVIGRAYRLNPTSSDQSYYIRPDKSIEFSRAPEYDITLMYGAYYDDLENDTDVLEVPYWSFEALSYYVASSALASNFQKFLMLNNFKTRVDSGGPEDSPTLIGIRYYMERYYDILKQHAIAIYQEPEW